MKKYLNKVFVVSMVFYGVSRIIDPIFDGFMEGKWDFSFLAELIVPILFGICFVAFTNFYKNYKDNKTRN